MFLPSLFCFSLSLCSGGPCPKQLPHKLLAKVWAVTCSTSRALPKAAASGRQTGDQTQSEEGWCIRLEIRFQMDQMGWLAPCFTVLVGVETYCSFSLISACLNTSRLLHKDAKGGTKKSRVLCFWNVFSFSFKRTPFKHHVRYFQICTYIYSYRLSTIPFPRQVCPPQLLQKAWYAPSQTSIWDCRMEDLGLEGGIPWNLLNTSEYISVLLLVLFLVWTFFFFVQKTPKNSAGIWREIAGIWRETAGIWRPMILNNFQWMMELILHLGK